MRTGMGSTFRKFCGWEVGVRLGWLPMTRRHLLPGIRSVISRVKYFNLYIYIYIYMRITTLKNDEQKHCDFR